MKLLNLLALALRWFACLFLVLVGLSLLGLTYLIAFNAESQPTRELGWDDRARIQAASSFVESHRKNAGQLPTGEEFSLWAGTAPSELRLEGVGFNYQKNDDSTYTFDWYAGRGAMLWWKSNSGTSYANISKDSYFQFGNRWADLVIYLGLAVTAFWGAKLSLTR